jgi:aminopeptidase-like protein
MNEKKISLDELERVFDELFPICRSLTGSGYRRSMEIIRRYMPLDIHKEATGNKIFDWEVPKEWNINSATLYDPAGDVVVDFSESNLHVVNYSIPIDVYLPLEELQNHLHSIECLPDLTPYVTSYYKRDWGFCLPHSKRIKLKEGMYRAVIDSSHENGYVEYGCLDLKGKSTKTILLSSYLCHPSLANDELSGPLGLMMLYNRISLWKDREYSYKFILNPETIGALCVIKKFKEDLKENVVGGIVLTCLGGPQEKLSYKASRRGNSSLDKLCEQLSSEGYINIRRFDGSEGSDERQYCAGELNLPVGQISKTIYGRYDEYHTSGDTKDFMDIKSLYSSVDEIENLLKLNELTRPVAKSFGCGEPQLSKYGMYKSLSIPPVMRKSCVNEEEFRIIMMNLLSYADKTKNIYDIGRIFNYSSSAVSKVALALLEKKLIHFV